MSDKGRQINRLLVPLLLKNSLIKFLSLSIENKVRKMSPSIVKIWYITNYFKI